MKLPVPQSVLGRLAERLLFVAAAAVITDILAAHTTPEVGGMGLVYLTLRFVLDIINKDIPTL